MGVDFFRAESYWGFTLGSAVGVLALRLSEKDTILMPTKKNGITVLPWIEDKVY
jgi:hypothetical protein